jgi:hypothetical protein
MIGLRTVAASVLAAGLMTAPLSEASAHRWHHGGPFFLWPFAAAGAVVAGAAAIATAPFAAVASPYYPPPPAYYAPPAAYYPPPGYYGAQPGYSYGAPGPVPYN